MNRDNSNFSFFDGLLPSTICSDEGSLSPHQRFLKILPCEPLFTPSERISLSLAAGELYCAEQLPDIRIFFNRFASDIELELDNAQLDAVAAAFHASFIHDDPPRADLMETVGPFDGPPAAIVQAVVSHVLASVEEDEAAAGLANQLAMAESRLRAVQGVKPALNEFAALDLAHGESLGRYQVEWAVMGFMAGLRSVQTDNPIIEPEFVYIQDIDPRIHANNFLAMAPVDAQKIYTQQIAAQHREQMQLTFLAAFRKFAEIGAYMAEYLQQQITIK